MSVELNVRLSEREADAWIRAYGEGRSGWHSRPSIALQTADFKVAGAIFSARSQEPGDAG